MLFLLRIILLYLYRCQIVKTLMGALFIEKADKLIYRGFHLLVSLIIMLIHFFGLKVLKKIQSIIIWTSLLFISLVIRFEAVLYPWLP